MSYADDLELHDEMFGLIFGEGIIETLDRNAHYVFQVRYKNGHVVPYTEEAVPGWSNLDIQTVFKKEDIEIMHYDISASNQKLKPKEIIKLRTKGLLEVKCPSGIWQPYTKCPSYITDEYLENEKFYLFRGAK